MKRIMKITWFAMVMVQFFPGECADYEIPMYASDRDEQIGVYEIEDKHYKRLVEGGYLPLRKTFLTDIELAEKLDLNLPHLADIKTALDKNDAVALEHALAAYLDTRLRPIKAPDPDYTSKANEMCLNAERWLGEELTFKVNNIEDRKYTLGERTNWYDFHHEGGPDILGWGPWGYALSTAYLATGDEKYVKGFLTYARSFYKNARPPAQRPTSWSGLMGPWSTGGSGRAYPGYMTWYYRAIAGSPAVSDKDKVMFLKMFYEHGDFMYQFLEEHVDVSSEGNVISGLLNMCVTFPEFLESQAWRERIYERATQGIQEVVLEDGGAFVRTSYHFAYHRPYYQTYRRLRDAGYTMPDSFCRALESMFDWAMWILSPLLQYPNLNLGTPYGRQEDMEAAAELFPERSDFAYLASGGSKGKPPERTDKVLTHTGFLTMRSDWSKDALYLCMNYNGSPLEISYDMHPDLLSFGLWANGRAYMTNSGNAVSYAHPLFKAWCKHTQSSNTVLVDKESQDFVTNGGRLENWVSLPFSSSDRIGFNYLVGVSDTYKRLGVSHRRAVLFVKPRYWLIHDILEPVSSEGKTHEYRWQGHFQPTELTVDTSTKIIRTKVEDGKCLYVIPLRPDLLELEKGSGPIAEPSEDLSGKDDGPYIHLIKKSSQTVYFTVLLYPTVNNAKPPVFEKLEVKEKNQSVPHEEAVGCKVIYDKNEDIIAIAATGGLRSYGDLTTDGESGYIRIEQGKIVEVCLVGGSQLNYKSKKILQASPYIASVYIRYAGDTRYADVRGKGKISVAGGSAKKIVLNGQIVSVKVTDELFNLSVTSPGPLNLTTPTLSTDPSELWKALVGSPPPQGVEVKNSVLVSWKTSVPSDAMIEYAPSGKERWIKNLNPEPTTDHWMVMSDLTPDETYKLRITCRSNDGRLGKLEATYTHREGSKGYEKNP